MADKLEEQGLLELSKIKRSDYQPLPKCLQVRAAAAAEDQGPLFSSQPAFEDVAALLTGKPPDYPLYHALSSLLNGLSSGPVQVMGMFRAVKDEAAVIRLYHAQRPQPEAPAQPLYFLLPRGVAALARSRKWVGDSAPTWLALLAALFHGYQDEDPATFYARKDLGGADNAAWLLLFGKDSSRAKYKERDKDKGDKSGTPGKENGKEDTASTAASLPVRVLGLESGEVDAALCTDVVFAGALDAGQAIRFTKTWQQWLKSVGYIPASKSRRGQDERTTSELLSLQKWLLARKGLPAALVWRLCAFFEANGLLKVPDKPRYAEGALTLHAGLTDAIEQRIPVAITLTDRGWQSLLPDSASPPKEAVEVVGTQSLPLPLGKKQPPILYVELAIPEHKGTRARWQERQGYQVLTEEKHKRGRHWVELGLLMQQSGQLLLGSSARAVLQPKRDLGGGLIALTGRAAQKITWPILK